MNPKYQATSEIEEISRFFLLRQEGLFMWDKVVWKYMPTIGERVLLIKHLHYLACHAGVNRTLTLIYD